MTALRDELLAESDNDMIEAASIFAHRLTRDDPDTFKVGYSQANAVLASVELFPEVTPFQIRFNNRWEVS